MARKPKANLTGGSSESLCPITAQSRLRLAADRQTDSIKDNFPAGVAKPALRALHAAGLTTLDYLTRVSEAELAALHGMGPKAIGLLRAALNAQGLRFRA